MNDFNLLRHSELIYFVLCVCVRFLGAAAAIQRKTHNTSRLHPATDTHNVEHDL